MAPYFVPATAATLSVLSTSDLWWPAIVSALVSVCVVALLLSTLWMCGCCGKDKERRMVQEKLDAAVEPPPLPAVSVVLQSGKTPPSGPASGKGPSAVKQLSAADHETVVWSGVGGGGGGKKRSNPPPMSGPAGPATLALADSRVFDKEFKITSSTDSTLFRRKAAPGASGKNVDQGNGQNSKQCKNSYKRASERPVAAVARRNARERRRVHTVNQAFNRLRAHVPTLKQKTKRVSKLKILKAAIDYVYDLQDILAEQDNEVEWSGSAKDGGVLQDVAACGDHPGQHRKPSDVNNALHTHLEYHAARMEMEVCPSHVVASHQQTISGEEHPLSPYQTFPHQYSLSAALVAGMCNSHGIAANRVPLPALPLAITDPAIPHTGHTDFAQCHVCGHIVNVFGGTGRCDHCSSLASYGYPAPAPFLQ